MAIEFVAELAECEVEFGRSAADDVIGFGECAEYCAQRLGRALAATPDVGLPPALEEVGAGDAIDHQLEDLPRVVAGSGGADVRLRCIEGGEQSGDLVVDLRGPSRHRERTLVDDDR